MARYFAAWLFCIVLCSFVRAQSFTRDLSYGFLLGPNLSGATVKYPTYPVSNPLPGVGFDLGGFAEFPVYNEKDRQIFFRPNLTYSLERASSEIEGDKARVHISFIKLPLDFLYHSDAINKDLSFGLGPYFAYDLGGKYNWQDTRINSIAFGSDSNTDFGRSYHRMDFGLELIATYRYQQKFVFSAKLDYGLLNMVDMTEDPAEEKLAKIHTVCFGITAGYILK